MVDMITWWTGKTLLVSWPGHMHLSVRNCLVNQAIFLGPISKMWWYNTFVTLPLTAVAKIVHIYSGVFWASVLQNEFPKCTLAQQFVHQTVFLIKGWGLDVSSNEWVELFKIGPQFDDSIFHLYTSHKNSSKNPWCVDLWSQNMPVWHWILMALTMKHRPDFWEFFWMCEGQEIGTFWAS